MEKNKKIMYILGIILAVSVILNIWFIYKLQAGGVWPPANSDSDHVLIQDEPMGIHVSD